MLHTLKIKFKAKSVIQFCFTNSLKIIIESKKGYDITCMCKSQHTSTLNFQHHQEVSEKKY